ncbi:MAG: zf-HC2 domain-containing protein [Planctomycetes bacterium]|nr:zf-HC2 domain-containing protein [Planctomycetota bacterium]
MNGSLLCVRYRRWVSAAHDGHLPAVRRVRLDAHLSSCGGCRAFRARIESLDGALAALPLALASHGELPAVPERSVPRHLIWSLGAWGGSFAVGTVVLTGVLLLQKEAILAGAAPRWFDVASWVALGILNVSLPTLVLLFAAGSPYRREALQVAALMWLGSTLYGAWAVPVGWFWSGDVIGLEYQAPGWREALLWGTGSVFAGIGAALLARARGLVAALQSRVLDVVSVAILRLSGAAALAASALACGVYRSVLGVVA